jgi:DNA-binding LacI/PurR family transcriptional regulator
MIQSRGKDMKSKENVNAGKKTTMSDMARYCGVSRQVISAVLLPEEKSNVRYSQQTYNTVVAAAETLNFRPNRTARSLLKHNHGSFGVLVQTLGNIQQQVLHRMLSMAKKYDKVLIMDHFGDQFDELPIIIKEDTVDGIAIFEDIPEEFQKELIRHNIPCVQVNNSAVDSPMSITYDEKQGMEIAVKHLLDKGRSKFALFLSGGDHYSVEARRQGFLEVMKEHKLDSEIIELSEKTDNYDKIYKFLSESSDLDAVILSQDHVAIELYKVMASLGKVVAKDISIVGVNNFEVCKNVNPALTSVGIDFFNLGETVIDTLYRYVSDPNAEHETIKMKYRLYERESS